MGLGASRSYIVVGRVLGCELKCVVEVKLWMKRGVKPAVMLVPNRWLCCLTHSNNSPSYKMTDIYRKMYMASVDTLLFGASLLADLHVLFV